MKKVEFKNRIGEVLFGNSFEVPNATKRIFIFEGMEEHSRRYKEMAEYLNNGGFNVYCIDVFGQGENVFSDLSNRGVWPEDAFNKYVDFVNEVVEEMNKDGKPTYLFCHSMGSFMGQSMLERHPNLFNKVILCGSGGNNPGLGIGYLLGKLTTNKHNWNNKSKLLAGIMFAGFNKKIQKPKTNFDWLSYNEENIKDYIEDPLCGYGARKGFCLEFIKGMMALYKKKNLEKLNPNTSIFLITGKEDPVTNYSKYTLELTKMYKKYGVKDVSFKIYINARHEIHNDNIKEEVFSDILNFYK